MCRRGSCAFSEVKPGHWKKQLPGKYLAIARKGDVEGLRALLREHPEFLNKRGSFGRTLLWEATRSGRMAAVKMLVGLGADVNANGCYNSETMVRITPYCAALYYRRTAIADYLWQCGPVLDIFRAAFMGDIAKVEQELGRDPELLNTEDPDDEIYYFPPISFAVAGGHLELTESLIRRGAEVAQYSAQLLVIAASASRRDLVDVLLHGGADARVLGSGVFASASDLDLLRYLIGKGLSPHARGISGFPPIVYVARGDKGEHPEKILLLLQLGADVNATHENGKTALHYAATAGHLKAVSVLLEHGANAALVDSDGNTALDCARAAKKKDACDLLMKHG